MNKKGTTKDLSQFQDFVRQKVIPGASQRDVEGRFATELYQEMFQRGWMSTFIARDYGGEGWALADLIYQFREMAYGSPGMFTTMVASLAGASVIQNFGSPELNNRVFRDYHKERPLFAMAMTEENSGFAVHRIRTTAVKKKNTFVLNGSKSYISNASYARHYCVFAQTVDEAGQKLGISVFYVPNDTEGLKPGKIFNKSGHREANTAELILENVEIPHANLIGEIGDGLMILGKCLIRSKTLISAAALGVCRRAGEIATQHLKSRKSGDQTLLDKPNLQHLLVRMQVEAEAAWLLTVSAAEQWDSGDWSRTASNMAKLFATDVAVKYVNECFELVGAQAFGFEHDLSRMHRDVKIFELYEGSSQILEAMIAKDIFDPAQDPLVWTRGKKAA